MVNQKKFQEFISMCQWMVQEGLPVVIFATIFKHFYLTGMGEACESLSTEKVGGLSWST